MTLDMTAFDAMLKEYYTTEKVHELAYIKNTTLGIFNKEQAGGDYYVQPIDHGKPGNASATIATAEANYVASKYKAFLISRVFQYITPKVTTETIIATKKNAESFAPGFREFDRGFKSLAEKLNRQLGRTATGKIGRSTTATNVGATVMTLEDKAQAWNFEEGDIVVLSSADGGGAVRTGTLTVASVQHADSTVTFTGNITAGVAAAVNTDFVFPAGDYDLCATGLESWLPVDDRTTVLGAAFHGVTRSAAPERLGGVYIDASGAGYGDLFEVLTTLVGEVAARGGTPDCVLINHTRFIQLQLSMGARKVDFQNITMDVKETIGGKTYVFNTAYPGMRALVGGYMVDILIDRTIATNRLYCLEKGTWTVWHSGSKLPCFPAEEVGAPMLVQQTADAYGTRVAAYFNLGCSAPGYNGVAKLAASS